MIFHPQNTLLSRFLHHFSRHNSITAARHLFTLQLKCREHLTLIFLYLKGGILYLIYSFGFTFIFPLWMKGHFDWSLVEKLKHRRKILSLQFLISVINKYVEKAKSAQVLTWSAILTWSSILTWFAILEFWFYFNFLSSYEIGLYWKT